MPVLSEDSVLIMDGAVKLYRRERSRKWQAAFQIDGQYIRISTGKSDLEGTCADERNAAPLNK